jgi:molybdopterin molybdotransferase
VEPLATSGAAILSSTTRADGFVLVPAELEGFAPGENIEVFFYDG